MFYDGLIEGRYVDLRSVEEGDAEFTLEIRQDPEFTRFLPRIENTLEQQKNWIQHQRNKEGDYFFVVQNKAGERIGTIGLFDVTDIQCEGGTSGYSRKSIGKYRSSIFIFSICISEASFARGHQLYLYGERTCTSV